jgi:hypothetical protein
MCINYYTVTKDIILNLLLQRLKYGTVFSWKTYIFRKDFEIKSMCGTCKQRSRPGKNHDIFLNPPK